MTKVKRKLTQKQKDEYVGQTLKVCQYDTKVFSKIFFPRRFILPFATIPIPNEDGTDGLPIHDRLFKAIDDKSKKRVVVKSSRNIGKTSIMQLAVPAKIILFREYNYIVPISVTAAHAMSQSESLKSHFETHPLIKEYFDFTWTLKTKEMWKISSYNKLLDQHHEIIVHPRGYTQQIRGLIEGDYRPNFYICDDLDDSKDSEDVREKKFEWFFGDLLDSLAENETEDDRVMAIGNPSGDASVIGRLTKDEDWERIELPICDSNYQSYWEEKHSTEGLIKKANNHRKHGKFRIFCREFMCIDMPPEERALKEEYFTGNILDETTHSHEQLKRMNHCAGFVIVDPARSDDPMADPTSIGGYALDTKTGKVNVDDMLSERLQPYDAMEKAFEMFLELPNPMFMCVEDAGLGQHIQHPYEDYALRHGIPCTFIYVKPRGKGKAFRIGMAQPYFRRGDFQFRESIVNICLAQGIAFPTGTHDDVIDNLAYVIQVLKENMQYLLDEKILGDYHHRVDGELKNTVTMEGEEIQMDDFELLEQSRIEHETEFIEEPYSSEELN